MRPTKPLAIEYYSEAVRNSVDGFPLSIRLSYRQIADLLMMEGPNLRMPYSRAMGNGLFELRPKGEEGIARLFYCRVPGGRIVISHAFIKKTEKTPAKDLHIAVRRMREVSHGKRLGKNT